MLNTIGYVVEKWNILTFSFWITTFVSGLYCLYCLAFSGDSYLKRPDSVLYDSVLYVIVSLEKKIPFYDKGFFKNIIFA